MQSSLHTSFLAGISRSLFKRLRLLLSSSKKPIDKLSSFVNIVAEELQTDVCSCYLMKNQETLELFASFGLDKEAIHKTRL
ncbi:MAG: peptidase, partial [Alphaproteobacteria bacterium]|nr:peptidase [Alphaproteobacteria bacterium]